MKVLLPDFIVLRSTAKAHCLRFASGRVVWCPKSVLTDDRDGARVERWWAEKVGLGA